MPKKPPSHEAPAKKSPAKKSPAKKSPAKKSPAKKSPRPKDTLKPKADPRATLGDRAFVEYPCIPLEIDGHTAVAFACSAKTLYQNVSINQRQDDKEEGYQRVLNPSRVRAIADYINGGGCFPTSVVIAFERASLRDGNCIRIEAHPKAGWVIDGQHRLAGTHEADRDTTVPVVGFLNLQIEDQIKFFVTINREQVGVPSSLYYDLLPHLDAGKKDEQLRAIDMNARALARALTQDEGSPFFGRIVINRAPVRGRELSMTNFIRKVRAYLQQPKGTLAAYSLEDRCRIINNYYRAIGIVFPEEFGKNRSFFFQTVGFGGLMDVMPLFMQRAIERGASLQTKEFVALFSKVQTFNIREFEGQGTGAGTEVAFARKLSKELDEALQSAPPTSKKVRIAD
jgi:DGQHR domain-containing protein